MQECTYCRKIFDTLLELLYHEEDEHEIIIPQSCDVCCVEFISRSSCLRHRQHKHETKKLASFLNNRSQSTESSSRKVAYVEVQKFLEVLGESFDNSMFLKQFRTSGSYSTDRKVFHADEFDFDVPLKFSLEKLQLNREGSRVYYHFHQRQKTLKLNIPMKVCSTRGWFNVPQGYVEIKTTNGDVVVPRSIQENLYQHLLSVKEKLNVIDSPAVDVSTEAKGPALTFTFKQKDLPKISVDLCPSITIRQISFADYNWPREETKKVLSEQLIKAVDEAGLHLIPGDLKFWYISVSRAGEALINGIDSSDKECRRNCHKILKIDFKTWLIRSGNNLPGMSTMIFEHQLFWMNEEKQLDWSQSKMADRYLDLLEDLSGRLRSGILFNYFMDYENILQDKDQQMLNRVANHAEARRQELIAMG